MLNLFFCLVLSLFAVAISNELYVFGPHSEDNSFAAEECIRPGIVCKNCTARTECIDIGEDDYFNFPSSPCPAGTTCVKSTGACTANPNPPCTNNLPNENYKFECHQIGVFPDPFNCKAYHLCAPTDPPGQDGPGLKSLEFTCSGDFYYDSRTTLCRKKMINGTCPDVTAPCRFEADVGVIVGNPALYYMCYTGTDPEGESFPQIFTCLNNFEYNVTARRCVDPTPISLSDANGICIAVGKFADPLVCSNYKDCLAVNDRPYNITCSAGRHFNPTTNQCIEYTCADLDK